MSTKTKAEWERRLRAWGQVLGQNLPCMRGFTIDVLNPHGPVPDRQKFGI